MKRQKTGPGKPGWVVAWLIQIVESLALGALASLSLGLHPLLYSVMLWGVLPLAGACTAYRAVLRGLLNYASWIAPPLCLLIAHTLIWGYVPPAGAMLLCAFIALVGAAAGEVMKAQKR